MLSSALRSTRAIQVNIAIMRAFVQMLRAIATNDGLRKAISASSSSLFVISPRAESVTNIG